MCDANVLISGILFPNSVPGKVLRYLGEQAVFVLATYVIAELYRVFQKKFPDKVSSLDRYLKRGEFELFVTPRDLRHVTLPQIRDGKDKPVLASTILADVDILITGDKDFVDVEIDRPAILTPAVFLELMKQI